MTSAAIVEYLPETQLNPIAKVILCDRIAAAIAAAVAAERERCAMLFEADDDFISAERIRAGAAPAPSPASGSPQ